MERLVFARDQAELLRALATRALHTTLVLYLGSHQDLDDELRSCAVTLGILEDGTGGTDGLRTSGALVPVQPFTDRSGELRAELLRR